MDLGTRAGSSAMINRRHDPHAGTTTVTFSLEDDRPVSVVADFNGWDPLVDPLLLRSNGLRSVAVTLPEGGDVRFRYLADGGEYFDDPDADHREPNGFGGTNGVLHLPVPERRR
jgi:hypothetical protein